MFGAPPPGPPNLRNALATVHRDGRWWAKCLGYGAAALTGVGLPLAAGFVMESLDNSRKGFPTPLPPWSEPSLRWLTGLFCLLIDFAFFVLPLLLGGILFVCSTVAYVAMNSTTGPAAALAPGLFAAVVGAITLFMFLAGVAPAGRLIFAREGKIEDALSMQPLRYALGKPQRATFLRARLASLPAYLPALGLGAASFGLTMAGFPGQILVVALGLWLTMAALVYAHLVVVQLYVAAEREAQRVMLGL